MNTDTERLNPKEVTRIQSAMKLSERPTLDQIAHREQDPPKWSDKRSAIPGQPHICHNYLQFYDRLWTPLRDEPIRLMEIGLNKGASIKLWLEYFQKGQIIGVDINEFVNEVGIPEEHLHRFIFEKGSQFSPYFWERFKEKEPQPFDIIIDDGAHTSGAIILSFNMLWGRIKPGGYYVIEDITEVNNPASHSPGYVDHLEFSLDKLGHTLMGEAEDIQEAYIMKDLLILRKKP